jgi:hypothetical protein
VAERLVNIQRPRLAVHALNDLAVDADSHDMLGGGQQAGLEAPGTSVMLNEVPDNETPYSIAGPDTS